jgi:hypothetical protein
MHQARRLNKAAVWRRPGRLDDVSRAAHAITLTHGSARSIGPRRGCPRAPPGLPRGPRPGTCITRAQRLVLDRRWYIPTRTAHVRCTTPQAENRSQASDGCLIEAPCLGHGDHGASLRQRSTHGLAVDGGDQAVRPDPGHREHVARVRQVRPHGRDVVVPSLLQRQRVEHRPRRLPASCQLRPLSVEAAVL